MVHRPQLRVNTAGRHITTALWSLGPQRTRAWVDLTLWIVDRGRGYVQTDAGRIDLGPGDALVLRGGAAYDFHSAPQDRIEHFFVHYDYLDPRGRPISPAKAPAPGLHRRLDDLLFAREVLARLIAARGDAMASAAWLGALLTEIAVQDAMPHEEHPGRSDPYGIKQLCAAIRDRPDRSWSVQAMARQVGCTPTHLARLFHAHAGRSPKQVILEARLTSARHLLRDSDLPIAVIAQQLGYCNVYFFSRQFRRHHGVTPTAFRAGRGG